MDTNISYEVNLSFRITDYKKSTADPFISLEFSFLSLLFIVWKTNVYRSGNNGVPRLGTLYRKSQKKESNLSYVYTKCCFDRRPFMYNKIIFNKNILEVSS